VEIIKILIPPLKGGFLKVKMDKLIKKRKNLGKKVNPKTIILTKPEHEKKNLGLKKKVTNKSEAEAQIIIGYEELCKKLEELIN
jgi:hypothetical protein